MKKLTCRDLGGPCDVEFTGASFEEIGKKCRQHVMEQMQEGDQAHLLAAQKMKDAAPEDQMTMMAEYRKKFDQAPVI